MLLAKIDGRSPNWNLQSSVWTSTFNTLPVSTASTYAFDQREARLYAYSTVPVTAIQVGFAAIASSSSAQPVIRKWLTIPLPSTSTLLSVMKAGVFVPASVSRSDWDTALGGYMSNSGEPNCNVNGINMFGYGANCMIGLGGNNENDCSSNDASQGLGCSSGAGLTAAGVTQACCNVQV